MAGGGYSCKTARETLEWIVAIKDFLEPYRFFLDAHVVNFFTDRLWEAVDKEWMDCCGENLWRISFKFLLVWCRYFLDVHIINFQNYWPASLKEFACTLRALSLPREQADLQGAFPGLNVASLNDVISQGMNQKKKHEIESLAAVIALIAGVIGANTVVDVGSGKGYLSQVLCFENELSVIAIDASSHHGSITDARAKRIKKYYAAKMRKSCPAQRGLSAPKTVTCRVLSPDMLKNISSLLQENDFEKSNIFDKSIEEKSRKGSIGSETASLSYTNEKSSLILAGLHACGDLSVTMLRTFVECEEVKSVVSIGCCYNLLSEKGIHKADFQSGFPMSKGANSASLLLGRSARDLACQSSDRWKDLGETAGLHNFELHAFRAAFQMVFDVASSCFTIAQILLRYYPEILIQSPAIGRQGKALRRQHRRRILESDAGTIKAADVVAEASSYLNDANEETDTVDRYSMFVKFCQSGLSRLGLSNFHDIDFSDLWKETKQFSELIGPYWTLRAALGPVLETVLLLDRLLFLQEQDDLLEAVMLPIFNPILSPRNVALIAKKL
ncbi:hypothetical protein F511_16822 [Dorcoceras hygrometricum]|uniref:Methyltransferase domain-containing protein n=1 Tax=Dorcoceras hygrometricum TaxID=472368 RepID=A0A2Z7A7W9_9LAMI|nr:hypothetical protein F511_16822 [Dorcoceras hygrometricum]